LRDRADRSRPSLEELETRQPPSRIPPEVVEGTPEEAQVGKHAVVHVRDLPDELAFRLRIGPSTLLPLTPPGAFAGALDELLTLVLGGVEDPVSALDDAVQLRLRPGLASVEAALPLTTRESSSAGAPP